MPNTERRSSSDSFTREYFDSLVMELRHIGARQPDTGFTLYGHPFSTPIMTAALSHMDKQHENGMAEIAKGAAAANAVMWAGMGSEEELERITATGAKTIKIIKPYQDNDLILRKMAHAEACGCIAVGMDIDHAFSTQGRPDVIFGQPMAGKSADDLKRLAAATNLPFIVKGVLSVRDAQLCVEAGCGGIVVSHHHGIMPYAVPPLMALPAIAAVARQAMPLFLDCCVESGLDAFKALALSANAVCVGRALVGPLREGGAGGVAQTLNEFTAQLAGAMAHTACPTLESIDGTVLHRLWE